MHISDADLEKLAFKRLSQAQLKQTVVATVSGQLEDSELDAIEEHFLACGTCVDRAEEQIQFVVAMRDAAAQMRKDEILQA